MPEIADGIVEIKACAREPGHRTKIAVWSNDHNVDPVGACVGARGGRVRMVVNELRGEKIDIVPFSEDFQDFVAKALSPAKVSQVIVSDDGTQADVIVPDHQLSLAIGREGQNARLAARLTGVRIDIRSETQLAEGIPARRDELEEGVEYAEGQWVTNAATGEMEWHAADGSVISESEWTAQAAAAQQQQEAEVVSTDEQPSTPERTPTSAPDEQRHAVGRSGGGATACVDAGARSSPSWSTPTGSVGRPSSRATICRRGVHATRRPRSAPASGAVAAGRRPSWCGVPSRRPGGPWSIVAPPVGERGCARHRVTASTWRSRRKAFERAWRRPTSEMSSLHRQWVDGEKG